MTIRTLFDIGFCANARRIPALKGVGEVASLRIETEPSRRVDDVYVTVSECAVRAAVKFKI